MNLGHYFWMLVICLLFPLFIISSSPKRKRKWHDGNLRMRWEKVWVFEFEWSEKKKGVDLSRWKLKNLLGLWHTGTLSCVCMHQGFDNCLFRAVWSKPVWEISPTHRPTKFIFWSCLTPVGTSLMMQTLVFTGLSRSYNSLLMSVEAIRYFPLHCWSWRFWYIGTVGWNLESLFFFMLRTISASQLPIGLHGTNTSKDLPTTGRMCPLS